MSKNIVTFCFASPSFWLFFRFFFNLFYFLKKHFLIFMCCHFQFFLPFFSLLRRLGFSFSSSSTVSHIKLCQVLKFASYFFRKEKITSLYTLTDPFVLGKYLLSGYLWAWDNFFSTCSEKSLFVSFWSHG